MKKYTKILLALSLSPFLVQPLIAAKDEGSQCPPKTTKLPSGTMTTLPNCNKVFNPTDGAPYCVVGCDVAVDCKGNKKHITLPPDKRWACHNNPGSGVGDLCDGKCYPTAK